MSVRHYLLAVGSLALLLGVVPAIHAQPPGEEIVVLEVAPDGLLLPEFIAWIGKHLDRPVAFAPAARQLAASGNRRIHFDRPVRLPKSDALRFGRKVLYAHKLAVVAMGEGPTAYYLVEAMDQPTVLHKKRRYVTEEELTTLREDYVLVSCVLRMKHVNVQQVQTQVQRLSPAATAFGAAIIPAPSENALIVVDFAPNAYNTVQLVRSMDVKADRPPPPMLSTHLKLAKELAALKLRVAALESKLAERRVKGK